MPVSLNGPIHNPAHLSMPPPPPRPPTVDHLRRLAATIAAELDDLQSLHRVTGDPDVLVDTYRLSARYTEVLRQLSGALMRERQQHPNAFGDSFANI